MNLFRKIIETNDGSKSIFIPEWNEHYHSKHGALQESKYVFIQNGLAECSEQEISVLEFGFGTGLNAFLTALHSQDYQNKIEYIAMEKYPVTKEEWQQLDYSEGSAALQEIFEKIHVADWEKEVKLLPNFTLVKLQKDFKEIDYQNRFDLLYFDAFGARVQPELWEKPIIEKSINALKSGGKWVSYACRGSLTRTLKELGCEVEKRPGAPGKREMTVAWKK